jgi:hypothetical protein
LLIDAETKRPGETEYTEETELSDERACYEYTEAKTIPRVVRPKVARDRNCTDGRC